MAFFRISLNAAFSILNGLRTHRVLTNNNLSVIENACIVDIRRRIETKIPSPISGHEGNLIAITGLDIDVFAEIAGFSLKRLREAILCGENMHDILGIGRPEYYTDTEKAALLADVRAAIQEIHRLQPAEMAWHENSTPTPEELREFFQEHGLSDNDAMKITGVSNRRTVSGWKTPNTKQPVPIWHWRLLLIYVGAI